MADDDRVGNVKMGLYVALVFFQGFGHFIWDEGWVDIVEAFEQLKERVVALRADGLGELGFVLVDGLPGYARSMAGGQKRQELVFAEERGEG